jgi:hypothetical protein
MRVSHATTFALANYRHMNEGKGTLKPVGHSLGTEEEGSERGISVTIWAHLKTKKPTFVGYFASATACHPVDVLPKNLINQGSWRWGGNSRQTPPTQCILASKCCLEHSRKDA